MNFTDNKYFIPGFAVAVTAIVVLVLLVFRGGVPDDAVASIDGDAIQKAQFDKTLTIYSSQGQPNAKGKPVVPDPPNFANCIANKRKTAPKKTKDAELKKQCQTEWDTAKGQIMTSLIQSKWYELEAKDRGIKVSDAEVKQTFTPLKQQTFPKDADYQRFLKSTGQTEADLLKLVKGNIYKQKVEQQAAKSAKPTAKQIEDEYKKNKKRYATPASRDLLVVFNSKKDKADAAFSALKGGDSFAKVAKKYSQDSASKTNGGKFPGVTKGQFEPSLDKAVFGAKKGALVGPVKTQFGYYIFQVTKITVAKQQSLKEAKQQIEQTLQSTNQQKAFTDFQKEFEGKWRKKTNCADLYKMELCKNGPKKKAGPSGAAGGAAAGAQ